MKRILFSIVFASLLLPVQVARAEALQITTTSLPSATVGQPYSYQLQATGGVAPYTWSAPSIITPSGVQGTNCCVLGVNNNGVFNTQTSATIVSPAGAYIWTFQVTDALGATAIKVLNWTVTSDLQITTTSLPDATVGQAYTTQLAASGGVAPYKWTPIDTNYPSGCCVLGISGDGPTFNTQTASTVENHPGSYYWKLKVTDSVGNTTTKTVYLTIKPANVNSYAYFQINTTQLPAATVGTYYSAKINLQYITTGTPYASNATFTGLPPGITTGSASGPNTTYGILPGIEGSPGKASVNILGTPTTAGVYTVTLNLTDQYSANLSYSYILTVNPASTYTPTPTPAPLPTPYANYNEGWLDSVSADLVSGWAYDNDKPVSVAISFQNVNDPSKYYVLNTSTMVYRADVGSYLSNKFHIGGITVPLGFNAPPNSVITTPGVYKIVKATYNGYSFNYTGNSGSMFTVGTGIPSAYPTPTPTYTPTPPTAGCGPKTAKVDDDPTIYFVTASCLKMPILSARVFLSYGNRWENIQTISQEDLDSYDSVDYIKLKGNARVYKIEDTVKRYIYPSAASRLNIDPNSVVEVNATEFYAYRSGSSIR